MKNKNERNFKVYMHISPSNKRYIGITRQDDANRRWENGYGYKDNIYFWKAIQKYGWDNFEHIILFEGLTKEEAEQKEIELIAYYDSANKENGYNIALGGSYNVNVELKPVKQYSVTGEFIKEYECIKYASVAVGINKANISLCCNNKAKTAGGYIWRFSDVDLTKEYLNWCNSDERENNRIPVCQYSKDGILIQRYDSVTDASIKTNTDLSLIVMCCKCKYRHSGNYIWRYEHDELTEEYLAWCNESRDEMCGKGVNQYFTDGTLACTYRSIKDASLKTGVRANGISMCCRGENKTSGGFIWRFSDDEISAEYIKWCNSVDERKGFGKGNTPVLQYTLDGSFVASYSSIREAQDVTGISKPSISAVCKGRKESVKGFIWRYASDVEK